jgi:hypothetical protein
MIRRNACATFSFQAVSCSSTRAFGKKTTGRRIEQSAGGIDPVVPRIAMSAHFIAA